MENYSLSIILSISVWTALISSPNVYPTELENNYYLLLSSCTGITGNVSTALGILLPMLSILYQQSTAHFSLVCSMTADYTKKVKVFCTLKTV